MCWKKCIPTNSRGGALDKGEQNCLANCVDRFMDLNYLTIKHLSSMRNSS